MIYIYIYRERERKMQQMLWDACLAKFALIIEVLSLSPIAITDALLPISLYRSVGEYHREKSWTWRSLEPGPKSLPSTRLRTTVDVSDAKKHDMSRYDTPPKITINSHSNLRIAWIPCHKVVLCLYGRAASPRAKHVREPIELSMYHPRLLEADILDSVQSGSQ